MPIWITAFHLEDTALPSECRLWWQSELEGMRQERDASNTETVVLVFFYPEPTVALKEIMSILRMYCW